MTLYETLAVLAKLNQKIAAVRLLRKLAEQVTGKTLMLRPALDIYLIIERAGPAPFLDSSMKLVEELGKHADKTLDVQITIRDVLDMIGELSKTSYDSNAARVRLDLERQRDDLVEDVNIKGEKIKNLEHELELEKNANARLTARDRWAEDQARHLRTLAKCTFHKVSVTEIDPIEYEVPKKTMTLEGDMKSIDLIDMVEKFFGKTE